MSRKPIVYLAGQSNKYADNWKEVFKKLPNFEFYDWEFDSDQTTADTFFPDDLRAVSKAVFLVANPGRAPSESTWIEIGYFYGLNTKSPGDFCDRLIIIWPRDRRPDWSIEFVKKTGLVVESVGEALEKLKHAAETLQNRR